MKLRSIVVEDEILANKSILRLCEKSNNIDLIDSFENGEAALQYLESNEVDLMFLDIEMPGISGFELLENLKKLPQVIFTTSNKDYAYEAFEYEVTDFIKKPIEAIRFDRAVEKAIKIEEDLKAVALSSSKSEIYLRVDGKYIRIPYDNILYFENVGDYIKIITDTKVHVFHGALKTINAKLNHPRLMKVHRSFIVNLDKIIDIEDSNIVIAKKVIPISRANKPTLMKSLNILN